MKISNIGRPIGYEKISSEKENGEKLKK